MAVDYDKLEDYQKKLFNHIKDVKDADVTSGEPVKAMITPAQFKVLKDQKDAWLRKEPGAANPFKNNDLFGRLAGSTHEDILSTWTTNTTFTTCNGLLGTCSNAMGVGALKTLDPTGGKPMGVALGQFEIATVLASRGLSHAWVPNVNGARPRYGDIFRAEEYHMGVSLHFEGDMWFSIESGQGGFSQGFDMLKRKNSKWGERKLLGWVDVATLLKDTTPLPGWLGGWWKVDDGGTTYYYYFDTNDCVYCQSNKPASTLLPANSSSFYGSFTVVKGKFQTVNIRWFTDDDEESFQIHTEPMKANEKIRDASKDTLKGHTFGGKPMVGVRLPGPMQTGLSYEEEKKLKAVAAAKKAAGG